MQGLLKGEGLETGRLHVATLMKKMGIEAIYRRPNTSKPAPGHKIYPYLLRKLAVTRPNQVWAMDLTYIPMARGFVYLCAVVDRFSRRVLSWRLSITMEADFCIEEVYLHACKTVPEERAGIGLYLNFYNTRRPDSSLGRQTPDQAYFTALAPMMVAA